MRKSKVLGPFALSKWAKPKKKKWLSLPSPVDLGWSDHNALEDADWSDEPKGKTWQDWHAHVKALHPVKYFLIETLTDFVKFKIWFPIKRPISDAHYWLVSHIVPSRRYHMLDLRQPIGKGELANIDSYRYGWRDVPEKMLYAMFNLLGEYLNEEKPHDLTQWYTREQIEADEGFKSQQDAIDEARAIYHWWTVGKKEEEKAQSDEQHLWWMAKKAKKLDEAKVHWDKMREMEEANEAKVDEMIARLMKIRRTLWT